jgi:O-antigen ligase
MNKHRLASPAVDVSPPKLHYNVLLMLLVGMILYIPNQLNFNIEFSIKGLNIITMMFLTTCVLALRVKRVDTTPMPVKKTLFFFFFVLVLACVIGILGDATDWFEDVTTLKNILLFTLLYAVYYRAVQDIATVRILFLTLLFVTFMASFQGMRQALDYGLSNYNESRRVSAPFGWSVFNANRSAAFFVIFLPLFASIGLFYSKSFWVRMLALGCTGLCIFSVFFTYSRQAYFILAVLALLLTFKKNWFIGLIVAAVLFSFESWAPETVVERIQSTEQKDEAITAPGPSVEGAGQGKYDQSTESRLIIWAGAGQMIAQSPWGIGLNHFKREIGTYVPLYKNMDAHNGYVLFSTEAGILGSVAMVALLLQLLMLGLRTQKLNNTVETKVLGMGYTMAVLSVMMSNIYGSRFFEGELMGNFWILTALVARYGALQKNKALI